jgi:hypothetical protein
VFSFGEKEVILYNVVGFLFNKQFTAGKLIEVVNMVQRCKVVQQLEKPF